MESEASYAGIIATVPANDATCMMHADQIHIDTDVARAMLFEQFPEYRHESIEPVGSGTVAAVFRIGTVACARFPLRGTEPAASENTIRREARAMTRFAEISPVASPRALGLGLPGPRYPLHWSVQSWVQGSVATPGGLADSSAMALDVADLIARTRSTPTGGERFDGQGRGGRLTDHDPWVATCLARSEGLLDVHRLRGLWARLRELPPPGDDVMSHKDLVPSNLLAQGDRLVGVIDCGSFGPADAALDLVSAWHLFDRHPRELVRSRLRSSDTEWRRGAAWAFQQAIGLVWYYERSNPAMSELGRSTLARLLGDPEIGGGAF